MAQLTPDQKEIFLSANEILEIIINNGIYSIETEEEYFSWYGCDYCNMSGAVNDIKGYLSLKHAQEDKKADVWLYS